MFDNLSPIWQSILRIIIGVLIGIPVVLYPYLYFFQERLIFLPHQEDPDQNDIIQGRNKMIAQVEAIRWNNPEGISLQGWLVRYGGRERLKEDNPPPLTFPNPTPLLIYFSGNAELATDFLMDNPFFYNWSILAVNYRGYGGSGGQPGETALFRDAEWLYDQVIVQKGIDPRKIVVMGRSLGSGVAVHLASVRPVAGVILVTPFDSLAAVVKVFYPYVPVDWLLRHRFDSIGKAPMIRAPLLALIAALDHITSPRHAEAILQAWGGPKESRIFPHANHNDIQYAPDYWKIIQKFLGDR